jgi:DDE superfamily endonuclease
VETELLVQADRLVGGSDAVLVIDDTAIPKKGTHSVDRGRSLSARRARLKPGPQGLDGFGLFRRERKPPDHHRAGVGSDAVEYPCGACASVDQDGA